MDTVAVTWKILDVNDITGDITVKFTNQNNNHKLRSTRIKVENPT